MTTATDSILICTEAHSGPAGDVKHGERLRASDPRVAQAPALFVPDGTPETEWPSHWARLAEQAEQREREEREERERLFLAAAKRNPVRLAAPRILTCRRDHAAMLDGKPAFVKKGSEALASDPVVTVEPSAWK